MHDSMMMAEVGGIVKVRGSRIATPLAPPRPGSTPMITPSRMPTSIKARLYQDNATLKPPISEVISSTGFPPLRRFRSLFGSSREQPAACWRRPVYGIWYANVSDAWQC